MERLPEILVGKSTLADLSEIDRATLHLRGMFGRFKPENQNEALVCKHALENGASEALEVWTIIDSPEGIEFRRQYNSGRGYDENGKKVRANQKQME